MNVGELPRVVFDCNVFMQALANKSGPAAACLRRVSGGDAILFVSEDVLSELREVLNRSSVRRQFPSLSDSIVEAFMHEVEVCSVFVPSVPEVFILWRDPKDARFVNLAIAAKAQFIVSRDKDLLDLSHRNDLESVDFRVRFPNISIINPVAFLNILDPIPEFEN